MEPALEAGSVDAVSAPAATRGGVGAPPVAARLSAVGRKILSRHDVDLHRSGVGVVRGRDRLVRALPAADHVGVGVPRGDRLACARHALELDDHVRVERADDEQRRARAVAAAQPPPRGRARAMARYARRRSPRFNVTPGILTFSQHLLRQVVWQIFATEASRAHTSLSDTATPVGVHGG